MEMGNLSCYGNGKFRMLWKWEISDVMEMGNFGCYGNGKFRMLWKLEILSHRPSPPVCPAFLRSRLLRPSNFLMDCSPRSITTTNTCAKEISTHHHGYHDEKRKSPIATELGNAKRIFFLFKTFSTKKKTHRYIKKSCLLKKKY
jgi:hypothetical protein